jgi:ATP-binding cassette subfamily B multidrug efflux pump
MLLRLLRQYLRPHSRLLAGVVFFQLLQSIASLYLPTLNAEIIDRGVATGDTGYILRTGAVMLGITVLQVACAITAVYFGARVAMGLGRDLRAAVFHQVGGFSEREVTTFGAASLITRSTNDVQQVQMLVLMTCTMLVSAPILAIGGIVLALQQDLQLSWLMAVSIPVLVIAIGLVISRMVPQFRLMQKRIDTINRVLREQLSGIRVVRAFVREDVETERFRRANDDVTATAYRVGRLTSLMFPIVMLVLNVSSVAVIWFGAFRIDDGSMQIGTLTAFLQYLMQILMAVMMATFMAIMIPRASVSADRIGEVLGTDSTVVPPSDPVTQLREHGTVELRDVGFAYPGAEQPVLTDIRFSVPVGCTTASAAPGRARPRSSTCCRACSTRPLAPFWSMAWMSRSSTPTCSGAASGWCRRSHTSSPAPWRATCATASRMPRTRSCGPRWRSRRPVISCARCRRASTR